MNSTDDQWLNFLQSASFYYRALYYALYETVSCSVAVGTVIAIIAYYFLYHWKPDISKDLSDTGFDYLKDGSMRTAENRCMSKKALVQAVQRRRAIGDLPPVYPNGWFTLLESSDVKKNEVKNVQALGESFAVFRSDAGKIHVLDAYCPHLGANMAVGGTVQGDCLECPFHKWRFSGDTGACTSVPYSTGSASVKAKTWPSTEINGLIFVWYHAEGEEPTWHLEPNSQIENKEWICHGRSDIIVGCHIQEIPENGADIGHLDALHGASFSAGADLRFSERIFHQFLRHNWSAEWNQSVKNPHIGLLSLTSESRIFGKFQLPKVVAAVRQIGPAYVELLLQTSLGNMLLIQTVTPIEPMRQRVIHRIHSTQLLAPIAKIILIAETIMFQRDVMVWNHKKYLSKPFLVKGDSTIVRHRRWYQQFYSENSPKFQFQRESLDW